MYNTGVYHRPVLLEESIAGMCIRPNGIYVDVTFGSGGHSCAILDKLSKEGKLIAFDQDPDAQKNAIDDPRFILASGNFSFLKNFLKYHNTYPIDGLIADLGVSSFQFDNPEKGFSIRKDGPLDLRMNPDMKLSAATVINTYPAEKLMAIFKQFGEVRNAYALAKKIVKLREETPFTSTLQLVEAIKTMAPRDKENKFLAQVFQALRIEINQELEALKTMLNQALEIMKSGGYISVISYHSLEDRLVKNFFKTGNFEGILEKDFYGNLLSPFIVETKKPIVPSQEEIAINNRARSAKLRIAKKR